MSLSEEDTKYLNSRVNPILEKLTTDLLANKPTDVVNFMMDWLLKKAGGSQTQAIRNHVAMCVEKGLVNKDVAESSESSDDDEAEEVIQPLPKGKQQRSGVSAESYGAHNKKEDFVPKVIPKNDEQKNRIRTKLEKAFMFQALDEKEKSIVVDAMEERVFKAGEYVIRQGEDGDVLFVVDKGELDCFKKFKKDQVEDTYLKTYYPGESFGELSLLYNAPRAASIRAKTDSVLFALDRGTFNAIVKDAAVRRRNRYEEFLKKVPLLDTMDPYERLQLADGLKPVKFKKGETVIRQGEKGDTFYIIEEGTAVATKKLDGDKDEIVFEYKTGDYFGELALLNDHPRAANIIATSDLSLVSMDRDTFARLLGPLKEILKRNMDKYIKYNFQG